MKKECIFTESSDRTHVLITEMRTKAGDWLQINKSYSQAGFDQKDYILEYGMQGFRQTIKGVKLENTDIRILNGMRKQVYSSAAHEIGKIFGSWTFLGDGEASTPCIDTPLHASSYTSKIASIRYQDSIEPDTIIMNINEQEGWNELVKILQNISFKNGGFKTTSKKKQTIEDDYLFWFKVECYSGLVFSVALYN